MSSAAPFPSTPVEPTGHSTPLCIGSTGGSSTGTPPPRAPLLATTHVSPVVYKLDANGNVIGGVRTPQVDAPIAALGSQGNSGGFCFLFGSTVPYSAAHLASLYKTPRPVRLSLGTCDSQGPSCRVPPPRRRRRAAALGGCFTSRTASPLTQIGTCWEAHGGIRSTSGVRPLFHSPEDAELPHRTDVRARAQEPK